MNILMGVVLMLAGALLVICHRHLVDLLIGSSGRFHHVDVSTSRENLLIVGAMMLLSGVGFFLL